MIPQELKEQLEEAAGRNNRSLSGEIIARLEQSLSLGKRLSDIEEGAETADVYIDELLTRIETLERRVDNLDGGNQEYYDGT